MQWDYHIILNHRLFYYIHLSYVVSSQKQTRIRLDSSLAIRADETLRQQDRLADRQMMLLMSSSRADKVRPARSVTVLLR